MGLVFLPCALIYSNVNNPELNYYHVVAGFLKFSAINHVMVIQSVVTKFKVMIYHIMQRKVNI